MLLLAPMALIDLYPQRYAVLLAAATGLGLFGALQATIVMQSVPGGYYHVTLRGNHRQDIFRDPADRSTLDAIARGASERTGARVIAYCWMTNHIHLVVQVDRQPLGRLMQLIGSKYARYLQRRCGTTGHLFERRYHAVSWSPGEHQLLHVVRYVHFNPVRAGLVAAAGRLPVVQSPLLSGPWLMCPGFIRKPCSDRWRRGLSRLVRSSPSSVGKRVQSPECHGHCQGGLANRVERRSTRPPRRRSARPGRTLDEIVAEVCRPGGCPESSYLAAPGKSHSLSAPARRNCRARHVRRVLHPLPKWPGASTGTCRRWPGQRPAGVGRRAAQIARCQTRYLWRFDIRVVQF